MKPLLKVSGPGNDANRNQFLMEDIPISQLADDLTADCAPELRRGQRILVFLTIASGLS
jgi:hypothetical protein